MSHSNASSRSCLFDPPAALRGDFEGELLISRDGLRGPCHSQLSYRAPLDRCRTQAADLGFDCAEQALIDDEALNPLVSGWREVNQFCQPAR